jgi:hydrogenase maturation protease
MKEVKNIIPEAGIKVIGFGNIFMSDDGLGIEVINRLRKRKIPAELIDGGTSAADLIIFSKNSKKMIIVDAVDAGQKQGEVIRFGAGEIARFRGRLKSYSLHDFDLSQAIAIIQKMKIVVDIVVIGIKPQKTGFGRGLSPEIEEKIPEIMEMVINEIYN